MTAPGGDWVEQVRRVVAGLAADPVGTAASGTAPFTDWVEQARRLSAEHRLAERLQGLLGNPPGGPEDARRPTAPGADATAPGTTAPDDAGSSARSGAAGRSGATGPGATEPEATGPGATGPGATAPRDSEPGATRHEAAAECRGCPLCAGLAALRGRRPDLTEALADVLAAAATALRGDGPGSAHRATPDSTTPGTTTRTTPDGSDAGTDVPAPDVPAGDAPAAPEKTVPHPAPAPVQRIDVA